MKKEYPPDQFISDVLNGGTDGVSCWRAESVERQQGSAIQGEGLFARTEISSGEVLAIKQGHVLTLADVKAHYNILGGTQQQIDENKFIAGLSHKEVELNLVGFNHSCQPNAKALVPDGLALALLISKESVAAGEEITVDYSTCHTTNTHRLYPCQCGSKACRGIIQPAYDWQDPDFQRRNMDDFPDFILRKIAERALRGEDSHVETTLKRADALLIAANWAIEEVRAVDEATSKLPRGLFRGFRKRSILGNHTDSIRKSTELTMEAARNFTEICSSSNLSIGNITDLNIDPNNPRSMRQNLPAIVRFANQLDHAFGQ